MIRRMLLALIVVSMARTAEHPNSGIWLSKAEIRSLSIEGRAWNRLKAAADDDPGIPQLSDQDERNNTLVLAKALVYARTGIESYRSAVIDQCMRAIGTESGGRTLAVARKLAAYVIAADLVGLPPDKNTAFQKWLRLVLTENLDGMSLQTTHERRPNNWGAYAGATRAAIALYLGDREELSRTAEVFKGWLGDRTAYAGFRYGDLSWQCDPMKPVAINPKDCTKDGHSIGGVLPDDQRRSGPFTWPPPKENYVYEALQGATLQAEILHRAGYDTYNWSDKALFRAVEWLYSTANFPAQGDDTWILPVLNRAYASNFTPSASPRQGKNMSWTDWSHAK